MPYEFTSEMPSIEELEQELDKEYEILESPAQKRVDALKMRIAGIEKEEISLYGTPDVILNLYHKAIRPFFAELLKKLGVLGEHYLNVWHTWAGDHKTAESLDEWTDEWITANDWLKTGHHDFLYRLWAFKKGGTETFDIHLDMRIFTERLWYGFSAHGLRNEEIIGEKNYHEIMTSEEINTLTDLIVEHTVEKIEQQIPLLEGRI